MSTTTAADQTYILIASASWARALYAVAALLVLLRQRAAYAVLIGRVLLSETLTEAHRFIAPPKGRHAAPTRTATAIARIAR